MAAAAQSIWPPGAGERGSRSDRTARDRAALRILWKPNVHHRVHNSPSHSVGDRLTWFHNFRGVSQFLQTNSRDVLSVSDEQSFGLDILIAISVTKLRAMHKTTALLPSDWSTTACVHFLSDWLWLLTMLPVCVTSWAACDVVL